MTPRELVKRALNGHEVPRPAVGPLAVHYCAKLTGVSLRDYTLKPDVLAACVIRYYERFQPDAVWLSADTWVNAQAMGGPVAFPGDNQPLGGTGEPLIKTATDIERIPAPDPSSQGRWPLMLNAMRRIRQGIGRGRLGHTRGRQLLKQRSGGFLEFVGKLGDSRTGHL